MIHVLHLEHMDRTPTSSATLGAVVAKARQEGGVDVRPNLSARELARRAGISAAQISRIESGQTLKPSREILVSLARALNRNPLPLLVLAGHLTDAEAQRELGAFFREGAEAPQEWGEWTRMPLDEARRALTTAEPDPARIQAIAADLFLIQETAETLWDDVYATMMARGEHAAQLRELMSNWRELDQSDRDLVRALVGALRRRHDLELEVEGLRTETATQVGSRESTASHLDPDSDEAASEDAT
jgi:transcriptional regulator with XRE-family HTH domain